MINKIGSKAKLAIGIVLLLLGLVGNFGLEISQSNPMVGSTFMAVSFIGSFLIYTVLTNEHS